MKECQVFLENKYTTWYFNIIKSALLRTIYTGYTEKHHIIPKSLGGDNSASNMVRLTAREHFICHILLTRMTSGKSKGKMIYAARCMSIMENKHQTRYVNSYLYEKIKEQYSELMMGHEHWGPFTQTEESNRARSEKLKGRKQKPRTPEHCKKLAFPKSEETRRRMSIAMSGKPRRKPGTETRKKMSDWQKGVSKPTVKCEYCGEVCSQMNHGRWHGNNCRNKDYS